MLMPDVNVLVYAHRQDDARHEPYRDWLQRVVGGPEPFALSVLVAVGFIRIVTNARIYLDATPRYPWRSRRSSSWPGIPGVG